MLNTYLILLLLWPTFALCQVNIEQYRSHSGALNKTYQEHINLTTSIKRSTSSLYSIGIKYFKPFEMRHAKGFLLSKINYGEANNNTYINNTFYHLRIVSNQQWMRVIPEAFLQYENNEFSLTNQRYLAGIGIRYTHGDITNGTSIINEWYKESEGVTKLNNWRLSQYIKMGFKLNPTNKLNITLYVQPSVADFSNIRYYSESTYISQITDTISYNSSLTAKFFSKSSQFDAVELFFDSGLQFKL